MIKVRVQEARFNLSEELDALRADGVGAIVSFQGIVRDTEGDLVALELEHYPAMTVGQIEEHCKTALKKWSLGGLTVIHRYGKLEPKDDIMMVAVSAEHRQAAFDAASFLMDYLKSRAPFWKKEHRLSGTSWVLPRREDEMALNRWDY
ncbi:MAG: molybdenum cofactor biosynthesis protein MoaE [Pseudomonadota bacterium]